MKYLVAVFSGAALLSGAFLMSGASQTIILSALMLVAPFLDKQWRFIDRFNARHVWISVLLVVVSVILSVLLEVDKSTVLNQFLFVSIPEEFFFRAYLMRIFGMGALANFISSMLFVLLHLLSRGWQVAVSVFIPSLLFGAVYDKYESFLIVVTMHYISNIIFITVISEFPQ